MAHSRSKNEDSLPKVIVCGTTEQNMPKLLVCEGNYKREEKEKVCGGSCNQDTIFKPKKSVSKKPPTVPLYQPPTMPSSPGINKLQSDLYQKQQAIENLQRTLCCLQCEMDFLTQQNAMLNEKMQQTCGSSLDVCAKPRRGKNATLEDRLDEFTQSTKMLEKQVCSMENNVKAMKKELSVVQAERKKREQDRNVIMIPGWCAPPFPCGMAPPACMAPPSCGPPPCGPPTQKTNHCG